MNPTTDQHSGHHVVIRLSALGDVVLTTGVLRYWHERRGWTFTVITGEAFAPVFDGHPAVREVVGIAPEDRRGPRLRRRLRDIAARYAGYGLIDLHGTGRTRLLGCFWKGPVARYAKKGLERRLFLASGGRLGRASLLRDNVPQRYALAVEPVAPPPSVLLPRLYLSADEETAGRALAALIPGVSPEKPLVALHPYAAHPGKIWPTEQWAALMRLLDEQALPWCLVGRVGDAERLPGVSEARDLTNRCTLRESAALLKACAALVTGDSGPMHLAAAVDTPVVALFGSTTREWGFYPAGPRDVVFERDLACRPCSLHGSGACARGYACLAEIAPEDVLAAVQRLSA